MKRMGSPKSGFLKGHILIIIFVKWTFQSPSIVDAPKVLKKDYILNISASQGRHFKKLIEKNTTDKKSYWV